MDWGYVKDQGNILVIVEAGSGWIEAFPAGNRTSETVKIYLSQIFARFGIPKTLVSDNGPEFVSGDLKQWCESLGIKKIESPVCHPRANGLAERAVQTKGKANKKLRQSMVSSVLEQSCDGFQETSSNLEVFFIKVSKNERRTYLTNFIAVSISNGHKTKLNSNFVLALSLSIICQANSRQKPTIYQQKPETETSTDLQLMNSIVPKPYMILMKC